MTVIAFHSPKGGAGNTLVTAGIARRAATRGQTVSAYDMTRQDSLKLFFGLLPHQKLIGANGEAMVVRGVRLNGNYVTQGERETAIERIKATPADELALVDIASADWDGWEQIRRFADLSICVIEPNPIGLASLTRLGEQVPVTERDDIAIVLNKLDDRRKLSRHCHRFMKQLFVNQFVGSIRRDESANEAIARFESLAEYAPNSVIITDVDILIDSIEQRLATTGLVRDPQKLRAVDPAERQTV
jgi:chromosome partitioning protein